MKQKILNWLEENAKLLMIIFLLVIPAIAGIVSGTIGFLENGFFGALAGLIRGVFYTYGYYLIIIPIGAIYTFFTDRNFRNDLLADLWFVWLFIIAGIIYFFYWLLTNY
jgi:hypothetical protein